MNQSGKITGISPGTATITVSLTMPLFGYTSLATCTVTVLPRIPDGTYFIKNRSAERYAQPDDADAPSYINNGGKAEIFSFNGENYQKWELEYLNNGYYKILNSVSEYALTVPTGYESTSNINLILKPYTGSDNQKWKITLTSHGSYKIKSKSSESYTSADLVMGIPSGSISDGLKIRQISYSNDTSYRDEWKLYKIDGSDVMFVAITEADGRDRISGFDKMFDYLSYDGYNDFNFINTNYLSPSSCLNQMQNASIFVSRSHGGFDSSKTWIILSQETPFSCLYSTDIYNNTVLVDLSSLELAIFAGCSTARNLSPGVINLADACFNAGVDYVIGFTNTIYCSEANNWVRNFFYYHSRLGFDIPESCEMASDDYTTIGALVYLVY